MIELRAFNLGWSGWVSPLRAQPARTIKAKQAITRLRRTVLLL
jgi:hypothetical protein